MDPALVSLMKLRRSLDRGQGLTHFTALIAQIPDPLLTTVWNSAAGVKPAPTTSKKSTLASGSQTQAGAEEEQEAEHLEYFHFLQCGSTTDSYAWGTSRTTTA